MKLTASWLTHSGTRKIFAALEGAGHQAYFVGGCVRNGLLGLSADDIDIATDAPPDAATELTEAAGLRAVPTGIDHGTVTVIANGKPHEVTTLRHDVTTDGRRATVAFTTDIADDAARRDFTMNALYARLDGEVLDPTGQGIDDLKEGRLRFIGHAEDRITEDYLRILRFFRFHAWYADTTKGLDPDGLAACAALADGIATLSKERLGAEMKKLLSAPDPAPEVAAMAQAGVLWRVVPGSDAKVLPVLVDLEHGTQPNPIARLASLGGEDVADALRLSKAEAKELELYCENIGSTVAAGELGYRFGEAEAQNILRLRAATFGNYVLASDVAAAKAGATATFPLKAADLMHKLSGPALGKRLKDLEQRWIASGFALDRDALLAES